MSRRLSALLIIFAWTLPGLLTASINLALFPVPVVRESLWVYFAVQLGGWWLWALLTPAIVRTVRRYPVERGRLRDIVFPHAVTLLICIISYIGVGAALALFGQANSPKIPGEQVETFAMLVRNYMGSRIPSGILLYATVAGLTTAIDERSRRREHELQTERLRAELARAQLQALQMHLQPHFLFNTLYAIAVLIEENPAIAAQTVVQLGDLLRHTLVLANEPEIPLRRELEILRGYLQIEETRFGDRLSVTIDVPESLLDVSVPSFILQPLVENAVRHGVAPRVDPGSVAIRAQRHGDRLVIEIEDDGPGFGADPERVKHDAGVGLATTRERLAVRYGSNAQVTLTDVPDGGALVTLHLPVLRG